MLAALKYLTLVRYSTKNAYMPPALDTCPPARTFSQVFAQVITTLVQEIANVNTFVTSCLLEFTYGYPHLGRSTGLHPALPMNTQEFTLVATGTFAERIKLLIQRVGSATEIARMCGFSEGVVRSWRDGNTDPSRARCVKLAQTLGISLVWLVAGEGTLQLDPTRPGGAGQYSGEKAAPPHLRSHLQAESQTQVTVDAQRLNMAMRILQSELELADSQLSLPENTDLLSRLYEILGPNGTHVDPIAMVAFNHQLSERIRREREATA